ncbi:hypothetical protein AQUSIP_06370 [Aquicella siphonis]|uniref:F-box domain-containing protein n=1 Tax=Aquicella siphonis TaxID=254247 RepID=A0A5E4PFX4_9COXI|nr:ankyrin repeat domain-containing protein [Aquicella siphonis]VVC75347.1 hypothetical protein AQUSIP_06370 [Aquicella siphonis]
MFRPNLLTLPIETVMHIYSYLNIESQSASALVCTDLYNMTASNHRFWRKAIVEHFPHHQEEVTHLEQALQLKSDDNNNDDDSDPAPWYQLFCKIYKAEYLNLTKNQRETFSLIKAGQPYDHRTLLTLDQITMVRDMSGMSMLDWAIKKRNQVFLNYVYQVAIKELSQQSNPQALLKYAALCNQSFNIIEELIANGAQLNHFYKFKKDERYTALQIATYYNNLDAINGLLKNGASVDIRDRKASVAQTALHIATEKGHYEAMDALLTHGADANKPSKHHVHSSALHIAAYYDDSKAIEILLRSDASITRQNRNGDTALQLAQKYNNETACKALGGNLDNVQDIYNYQMNS